MKHLLIICLLALISCLVFGQQKNEVTDRDSTYFDIINVSKINGIDVFAKDTFSEIVKRKISKKNLELLENVNIPSIYFMNKKRTRYLKIYGGPDRGFAWFYTIGKIEMNKYTNGGLFLGRENVSDFVIDNDIKIGDDLSKVWDRAHLLYFRDFFYKGIRYFYFEKGVSVEVPFTPEYIFYYKFNKQNKLIEIGFGYGMRGFNPMFP